MKFQNPINITALLSASILLTACGGGGGSTSITPDPQGDTHTYTTLDAATDITSASHVELGDGHTVTDNTWHFAYQKYVGFKVNGGFSGPGTVEGCIAHQYSDLFDTNGNAVESEFRELTRENTAANFDRVDKTSCTTMVKDTLVTQIKTSDWRNYNPQTHALSAKTGSENGWIIRSSTKIAGTDDYNYARVKVKTLTVTHNPTTREVVLSVENWDANTSGFSAAVDSPVLNFSSNKVFYNFEDNTVSATETAGWDLSISVNGRDYPIQVNAGASGNGSGGVAVIQSANAANAAAVTNPVAEQDSQSQVYRYFGDAVEGILSEPGNYGPLQYAVAGGHEMWPTFTTYILKDDTSFYKFQVVSNKGENGDLASGNLYIRYEELN